MPALIQQESGGRAGVQGPQTQYGRALGLTQLLPATAKEMAGKIGAEWRPELLRGTSKEASDYQRALGEAYLQEGLDKTGNLRDALHYYHGGPNQQLWGKRTRKYADQVIDRLGMAPESGGVQGMSDSDLMAALGGPVAAGKATKAEPFKPVTAADIGKTFTPGYAKARARVDERAQDLRLHKRDITDQMFANMGVNAPIVGAVEALNQGGENILRRFQGKDIEVPASAAYRAGRDEEKEQAARFASEHPTQNVLASILGIAVSGKPGLSASGATMAGRTGNALQTGAGAAAANLPIAAIRSEGNLGDLAKEEAMSFGLGSLGQAGGNLLMRAGQKAASAAPSAARALANEGVLLTPGQIAEDVIPGAGGMLRKAEDALSSLPVGVNAARRRGFETLNQAAANRALREIGEELPKDVPAGFEAVKHVGDRLGAVYDEALAKAPQIARDAPLDQAVIDAMDDADDLIDLNLAEGLKKAIKTRVDRAFDGGAIDGKRWKELDSQLAAIGRETDSVRASEIVGDVRSALAELLERSSAPEVAARVRAANKGWATLMRLERAAKGSAGGIATPAKIAQSASQMGGRRAARGEAMLQDLAESGRKVLPSTVNDSGTASRTMLLGMIGGGGAAAGLLPQALLSTATLAALYSKPVQGLLNALYRAKTPGAVRSALGRLKSLAARNPALVPVYEQALADLGADVQGEGRPARQEARRAATRR